MPNEGVWAAISAELHGDERRNEALELLKLAFEAKPEWDDPDFCQFVSKSEKIAASYSN